VGKSVKGWGERKSKEYSAPEESPEESPD